MAHALPSPSTGGAAVAKEPLAEASPSRSRRRDKPQLSCNLCRRRKLRCDRHHPCSTCLSRGLGCTYADTPAPPSSRQPEPSVQQRLAQLESLVISLMGSVRSNLSPGFIPSGDGALDDEASLADDSFDVPSECGSIRVIDSELRYVSGEHWAAIFDSITNLKNRLDRDQQLQLEGSLDSSLGHDGYDIAGADCSSSHAILLYGCRRLPSRAEILTALPPKVAVDRYISRYFNSLEIASCIAHGPSFLRQYDALLANPSSVPIAWIGLLFSVICLAVATSDTTDASELTQRTLQINLYREKIVQCLVLGEYTKPGPHVMETMLHYLHIEFAIRADADKDTWFLLALVVNMAMRMGYHRDPGHFPAMSPLQGETRRRVWATVIQADILISAQMGMPRMISEFQWDTAEPRNFNDADLEHNELPAPRPETEHTTTLGIIARRRLLVAVGTIMDLTTAVKSCSYAEVMRADGVLHEAAARIPPPLKPKSLAASVTDSAQVIMARLFISYLLYKGQILLHRRFLYMQSPSPSQDTFAYSREACLNASLDTLQIQQILDEETCPSGQLHMMRWRLSSIMNHQFLTATMILCSLLQRGQTLQRKGDIISALQKTRSIWLRSSERSHEATKAAETVNLVLADLIDNAQETTASNDSDASIVDREKRENQDHPLSNFSIFPNADDVVTGLNGLEAMPNCGNLESVFSRPVRQTQNFAFDLDMSEPGILWNEWALGRDDGTRWPLHHEDGHS